MLMMMLGAEDCVCFGFPVKIRFVYAGFAYREVASTSADILHHLETF